jgi:DNA-directed RNA polymerase subunit beta
MTNLQEEIAKAPIPTPEHMLGKGSMMPFNSSNSGGRKLMFGVNLEQRLPLIDPDVPFIQTGFEHQFGIYSSSYVTAEDDYRVIAIIPKFQHAPIFHEYYILLSTDETKLKVIESVSYKHFTENYGYLYNHKSLDSLHVGDVINTGDVLTKSNAFDEYDNRMDGKNLLVLYNSSERTMEDGIILSKSAAKKLASPLIHKIKIVINDNDIPLNLYGTRDSYKTFPDVGEMVKNSIVMSYRREKKEEALFSQSYDRLMSCTLSDEKITCSGKVVDIDINSNDPTKLDGVYFGQIKYYWDDRIRFCHELVDAVKPYVDNGVKMEYNLQVLYYKCEGILSGKQFFNERVFSNLNIDITVIEEIPIHTGDKITNRYGGKGVVSKVLDDDLMPKTYDGDVYDAQVNMCGVK